MYKHNKKVSLLLVIVILSQMLFMPQLAQAQQLATLPPQATAVVTGGERFMDAVPAAMEHALKLGQLLEYIAQADPNTLPESTLADARNHALEAAQQAAIAQGAAGLIANGIEDLAPQIQAAADMDALVANLDSDGFSAEMETVLTDAGLSAAQISDLEANTVNAFQNRRVISQTGFVTETVAYLLAGGLTPAQISQVEDEYATYGLADVTLSDKLAQLRAGQDEMTLMRAETLQAYTQLLSHQVFLRYQNGQTGRAATAEEIEALIQDELRLLTHIGYLNELVGSGAVDPEVGEGQWLFIERYSRQAAERLETLILETQNVGLVVDLFILRQIHTTALIAQSGDPVFAKNELDIVDDVLANLLGDSLPGAQAALQAEPPFLWRVGLTLSQLVGKELLAWEAVPEPEIKTDAVAVSKELVDGRISRLGVPAALLPLAAGDIQELDETNNVDWLHFYSALPTDQPPGLISILEQVIPGLQNILDFVWGALTGQTDNPFAIGANIILSFVPVLGELLDLIALFTEPTTWGKVMALIGLLASILSDGAEILATIGAVIPPTLAATVPGALLLEAIDIGAAILKPINRFVNAQIASIISRIPFDRVLRLGGDVLSRLARNAVDSVGGASGWPHSIEAAISLVQSVVRSVIDPFSALLSRFSNNLSKLYELEFGDGGYLVGRILDLSDDAASYSDEVLEGIGRMGDDLAENGIELSDEASEGLGEAADTLGEQQTRQVFTQCFIGAVTGLRDTTAKYSHSARLAFGRIVYRVYNANAGFCDDALEVFESLSQNAQRGIAKLQTANVDAEALLLKYADEVPPHTVLDDLLGIVDESGYTAWKQTEVDILEDIVLKSTLHGLSKDAIKFLPINTLDDARYPGFADFLTDSANNGYLSDPTRVANLNALAAQGNRQAVQGHMSNIMGEYRELRYQDFATGQGHTPIFQHTGPVNEPGLDAFTHQNSTNTYFMGEVKDRGSGGGLTLDGPRTPNNNLTPPEFENYMRRENGQYVFNRQYLDDTLNEWVNDPNIPFTQSDMDDVIQAAQTGNLQINIFAGGRTNPFGRSLQNAIRGGLRNPYTQSGTPRIIVNLIPD